MPNGTDQPISGYGSHNGASLPVNPPAPLWVATIGGSIGLAPGYLKRVSDHLGEEPELFRPQLVAASLGQDSGLIGALLLSMDAA